MARIQQWSIAIPFLCVAAACSDTIADVALPRCTTGIGPQVNLAVGEYAVYDGAADSGCIVFPANGSGSEAEYLVAIQIADGSPGASSSFVLEGGVDVPAAGARAFAEPTAAEPGPAERFHMGLRELEATRFAALPPAPPSAWRAAPVRPVTTTPPTIGETRTFSVCATLSPACVRFDPVTASARAVGQRLAIFVDETAPPNGLNDEDLDTLISVFDDRLYAADTASFGRESDINGDGVVIVLMTTIVNRLVTEASCKKDGFVVGFFVGADIDPLFANDTRVNHAEVFYSVVADPTATLSCVHDRAQVKRIVPITFIHEFQHMISYNQHVLVRNGNPETLWLGEAMSHYAEEVGGNTYLAEGDTATFESFVIGNLFNAKEYFTEPGKFFVFPRSGIGSLAERGAGWLYLRYVIDQYAADTSLAARNAFTRTLVATSQVGALNVIAASGAPIAETATRWALANWVDDLPGFTTPPELQYPSWDFRQEYAHLNATRPTNFPTVFPLDPPLTPGEDAYLVGVMRSGAPYYHRVTQPPGGAPFTLRFGTGYLTLFAETANVRVSVVRTR